MRKVQVTAEDVKFSFEYYLDPAHESVRYTSLADTIDKIEVVDDFTIKFYTKVLMFYLNTKCVRTTSSPKRES